MKTLKTILQEVISGIKAWVDTNTVHKSGTETIGGAKVLTEPLAIVKNPSGIFMTNPDITLGTPPTGTNRYYGDYYLDTNGDQVGYSLFQCNKNGNNCILWGVVNTDGTNTYQSQIKFTVFPAGGNALFPSESGCNLGLATNKWETFNGLNPGALSLPDMDSTVSKSTELATAIDKTQTANNWTADFTGILRITWFVKNLTGPFRCSVCNNSDIRYATWGQTFSANDVWYFIVSFPVQNGKTYYFDNSFTRTSEDTSPIVYGASAVYCLGNV